MPKMVRVTHLGDCFGHVGHFCPAGGDVIAFCPLCGAEVKIEDEVLISALGGEVEIGDFSFCPTTSFELR